MNNPDLSLKKKEVNELDQARHEQLTSFIDKITSPHIQVNPCFMTGRACVYSENIEAKIKNLDGGKKSKYEGFVIMPFRPNINLYYTNCFKPFVEENYLEKEIYFNNEGKEITKIIKQINLDTANQVRRPGVIICEGICKKIQESDFIIADLSLPNSNVFYELGLAYGLNQKIIVIYKDDINSNYKKELESMLDNLNCSQRYNYKDLKPITISEKLEPDSVHLLLTPKVWQRSEVTKSVKSGVKIKEKDSKSTKGFIVFYSQDKNFNTEITKANEIQEIANKTKKEAIINSEGIFFNLIDTPDKFDDDINLAFNIQVPSAIGISISDIYNEIKDQEGYSKVSEFIYSLKSSVSYTSATDLQKIKEVHENIDSCYCFVVRTGGEECHPMAYFWLGYCHATGKNVIPITIVDDIKSRIDDLAFDIRAHRHITFIKNKPELFTHEIKETLRLMIKSDFKDLYRKRFWNGIIGKAGAISIFTGALHSNFHNREMVGDWDLLSVSELTSYFGRNQFRFKIEAPIYPPETAYKDFIKQQKNKQTGILQNVFKKSYIEQLQAKLENKNCIIIASPDVNPLTEIIFGKIFGLEDHYEEYFSEPDRLATYINHNVCISYKSKKEEQKSDSDKTKFGRTFYQEEIISDSQSECTGIRIVQPDQDKGNDVSNVISFLSRKPTVEPESNLDKPVVRGHLFIARNPFGEDKEKFIIILNGIGGPATFALTHAITGGIIKEFTVYKKTDSMLTDDSSPEKGFNPEINSESILEKISEIINIHDFKFTEVIIKVHIEPIQIDNDQQEGKNALRISDWRRIASWELEPKAFDGDPIRYFPKS
jgi:nucleoside 2-deoxyribosyltransferase